MHSLAVVLEHLRLVEGALVDLLVVLARLQLLLVHQHALDVPYALFISSYDNMALTCLCNTTLIVLAVLAIVLILEIDRQGLMCCVGQVAIQGRLDSLLSQRGSCSRNDRRFGGFLILWLGWRS